MADEPKKEEISTRQISSLTYAITNLNKTVAKMTGGSSVPGRRNKDLSGNPVLGYGMERFLKTDEYRKIKADSAKRIEATLQRQEQEVAGMVTDHAEAVTGMLGTIRNQLQEGQKKVVAAMKTTTRTAAAPIRGAYKAGKDYGQALDLEPPMGRQLIGSSVARINPIMGYMAQKFFDTQMYEKMKDKVKGVGSDWFGKKPKPGEAPFAARGGKVKTTGLAVVHAGEEIVPAGGKSKGTYLPTGWGRTATERKQIGNIKTEQDLQKSMLLTLIRIKDILKKNVGSDKPSDRVALPVGGVGDNPMSRKQLITGTDITTIRIKQGQELSGGRRALRAGLAVGGGGLETAAISDPQWRSVALLSQIKRTLGQQGANWGERVSAMLNTFLVRHPMMYGTYKFLQVWSKTAQSIFITKPSALFRFRFGMRYRNELPVKVGSPLYDTVNVLGQLYVAFRYFGEQNREQLNRLLGVFGVKGVGAYRMGRNLWEIGKDLAKKFKGKKEDAKAGLNIAHKFLKEQKFGESWSERGAGQSKAGAAVSKVAGLLGTDLYEDMRKAIVKGLEYFGFDKEEMAAKEVQDEKDREMQQKSAACTCNMEKVAKDEQKRDTINDRDDKRFQRAVIDYTRWDRFKNSMSTLIAFLSPFVTAGLWFFKVFWTKFYMSLAKIGKFLGLTGKVAGLASKARGAMVGTSIALSGSKTFMRALNVGTKAVNLVKTFFLAPFNKILGGFFKVDLAKWYSVFKGTLGHMGSMFKGLARTLVFVGSRFQAIFPPITLLMSVIGGIKGIFKTKSIFGKEASIRQYISSLFAGVIDALLDIIRMPINLILKYVLKVEWQIPSLIKPIAIAIDWVLAAVGKIVDVIVYIGKALMTSVNLIFQTILFPIKIFFNPKAAIKDLAGAVWASIKQAWDVVVKFAWDFPFWLVTTAISLIWGGIKLLAKGAIGLIKLPAKILTSIISTGFDLAVWIVTTIVKGLKAVFIDFPIWLAKKFWEGVKAIGKFIADIPKNIYNAITAFLASLPLIGRFFKKSPSEKMKEALGTGVEKAKEAYGTAKEAVASGYEKAKEVAEPYVEKGKGLYEKAKEGAEDNMPSFDVASKTPWQVTKNTVAQLHKGEVIGTPKNLGMNKENSNWWATTKGASRNAAEGGLSGCYKELVKIRIILEKKFGKWDSKGFFGDIWDSIKKFIKTLLGIPKKLFNSLMDALLFIPKKIYGFFEWMVTSTINTVKSVFTKVFIDFPKMVWTKFKNLVSSVVGAVVSGFRKVFIEIPKAIWKAFTDWITGKGKLVAKGAADVKSWIGNIISSILGFFKRIFIDLPKAIFIEIPKRLWNVVASAVSYLGVLVKNTFKRFFGGIWGAVKQFLKSIPIIGRFFKEDEQKDLEAEADFYGVKPDAIYVGKKIDNIFKFLVHKFGIGAGKEEGVGPYQETPRGPVERGGAGWWATTKGPPPEAPTAKEGEGPSYYGGAYEEKGLGKERRMQAEEAAAKERFQAAKGKVKEIPQMVADTVSGRGGELGSSVAKWESGKKGSGAIGWDSTGGASYGKYQIATKTGTMKNFLEYAKENNPEVYERLSKQAGSMGDKAGGFAQEWQNMAKEGKLKDLEHGFIKKSHFDPALAKLPKELQEQIAKNPALQESLWSTSVQHGAGGASSIWNKAAEGGAQGKDLISKVYDARGTKFGSSTAKVRESVQNRFKDEKAQMLAMLDKKGIDISDVAKSEAAGKMMDTRAAMAGAKNVGDKVTEAGKETAGQMSNAVINSSQNITNSVASSSQQSDPTQNPYWKDLKDLLSGSVV
jgi:hypothetical protein